MVASQGGNLLACPRLARRRFGPAGYAIPQPNGLVVGAAGKSIAIGSPSEAADSRHVSNKSVHVRAGRGIPDLERRVCGRRGDEPAIGRYPHLGDRFRVAM